MLQNDVPDPVHPLHQRATRSLPLQSRIRPHDGLSDRLPPRHIRIQPSQQITPLEKSLGLIRLVAPDIYEPPPLIPADVRHDIPGLHAILR